MNVPFLFMYELIEANAKSVHGVSIAAQFRSGPRPFPEIMKRPEISTSSPASWLWSIDRTR